MSIFVERIEEVKGKIAFYKLFRNDRCLFDEFVLECERVGGLDSELIQIQARMQQVADLQLLPVQKFRDITPKGSLYKQYEIKTKHLRVYLLHDHSRGRIVVTGGKKTDQKKDILRFRSLVELYWKEM